MEKKDLIYQSKQIREFEQLAAQEFEISSEEQMQRAGLAAYELIQRKWPSLKKIAVFCGNGNNGGDGFVVAKLAFDHGLEVSIWRLTDEPPKSAEAKAALEKCIESKIAIDVLTPATDFGAPELVIDAICGIGLKKTIEEPLKTLLQKIASLQVPILALDVPTGINADTGSLQGYALRANVTLTYIGLKLGLLTGDGIAYSGDVSINNLEMPAELADKINPVAFKMRFNDFAAKYLTARPRNWHKGLSGHLLIIGGDKGYAGAVRMAAIAGLRVGAGLVSVATHPDNAPFINVGAPEVMSHGISNARELEPLIERANVIAIGPGLRMSTWAERLWRIAINAGLPLVVDADALNILAETKHRSNEWVLTPHPGEAARLLKITPQEVQQDRLKALLAIQERFGGTCVLKGAGSLVADENLPGLTDKGNPGLSTAGTGDILSGIIGGLIAQGVPINDAAKMGVCLHAHAGDLAAKDGERGMIATDLMPFLRRLSNYYRPL